MSGFFLYCVHDHVGHLGIFVSGSVAKKEHREFAGNIDLVDCLPLSRFKEAIRKQYFMLLLDEQRAVAAIPALLTGHEQEGVRTTGADPPDHHRRRPPGCRRGEAFPGNREVVYAAEARRPQENHRGKAPGACPKEGRRAPPIDRINVFPAVE